MPRRRRVGPTRQKFIRVDFGSTPLPNNVSDRSFEYLGRSTGIRPGIIYPPTRRVKAVVPPYASTVEVPGDLVPSPACRRRVRGKGCHGTLRHVQTGKCRRVFERNLAWAAVRLDTTLDTRPLGLGDGFGGTGLKWSPQRPVWTVPTRFTSFLPCQQELREGLESDGSAGERLQSVERPLG
jgi:hypothetical protein